MDVADVIGILQRMETLLRRNGQTGHADQVAGLIAEVEPRRFDAEIVSMAFWGGEGAVVDTTFSNGDDDRAFNELIVDLAEALDLLGLATPRSRWVGQTIEDWLIAHPRI